VRFEDTFGAVRDVVGMVRLVHPSNGLVIAGGLPASVKRPYYTVASPQHRAGNFPARAPCAWALPEKVSFNDNVLYTGSVGEAAGQRQSEH
jgi:hypothetical protein